MKLLSAKIRGALGFNYEHPDNINQEEIEIDFTQFKPGLIALIGPNGSGKSTLLNNLQPYLMLADRDGKLQDHFYLKNSHRILKLEMNEKVYECKVLIDGLTGAAEAYLTENGEPLNDGKLTTYKEQVNHIFGTPETFFNSRFSAQTPANISSLKFAQRRALFYEILNLLKYETHCKNAGKRLAKENIKLATLDGELKILADEIATVTYTKPMIAEKIYHQQEKEKMIKVGNEVLTTIKNELGQVKKKVIQLETLKDQMQSIKQDLDEANLSIENYNIDLENNIGSLKKEREQKITDYEKDNEHLKEAERLESDKKIAEEKYELDKKQIYDSIEKVKKEILDHQAKIDAEKIKLDRVERIQKNKQQIEDNLARKKEVTEKLNKLMVNDNSLTLELAKVKEDKNLRLQKTKDTQTEIDLTNKSINQIIDKNIADEKRCEELRKEKQDKIDEVETETKILSDVPCDEAMGSTCPLIGNTVAKKQKLDQVKQDFDNKINLLIEIIEAHKTEVQELTAIVKERTKQKETELENIESEFTPKIKDYDKKIEEIGTEVKTLTKELTEINKSDWDKFKIELTESEQTKLLANQSIENEKVLIDEKEKSKHNLDISLNTASDNYIDKTKSIDDQIESKKKLFTAGRVTIVQTYNDKIENVKSNSSKSLEDLNKKRDELVKKYDADIETNYNKELGNQTKFVADETEAVEAIDKMKQELADQEAEIKTMEEALAKKKLNEDKIAEKEAGKALIGREIKEYSLIEKAFNKTGIPVLKLENSSYQITNIANEILSNFDNQFRIKFDTLEPTADGKSLKEVFNINIIDSKGVAEISMKSGGEKVWLNTALQLSIGVLLQRQGKKIQTSFIDEKDDGLTEASALHYLEMLRRIHALSNAYHTLVVTHKSILQDLIPQKILFVKDEGIKIITEEL